MGDYGRFRDYLEQENIGSPNYTPVRGSRIEEAVNEPYTPVSTKKLIARATGGTFNPYQPDGEPQVDEEGVPVAQAQRVTGAEGLMDLGSASSKAYQFHATRADKRIGETRERVRELVKLDPTNPLALLVTALGAREEILTNQELSQIRNSYGKKERLTQIKETFLADIKSAGQSKAFERMVNRDYGGDTDAAIMDLHDKKHKLAKEYSKPYAVDMDDYAKMSKRYSELVDHIELAEDGLVSGKALTRMKTSAMWMRKWLDRQDKLRAGERVASDKDIARFAKEGDSIESEFAKGLEAQEKEIQDVISGKKKKLTKGTVKALRKRLNNLQQLQKAASGNYGAKLTERQIRELGKLEGLLKDYTKDIESLSNQIKADKTDPTLASIEANQAKTKEFGGRGGDMSGATNREVHRQRVKEYFASAATDRGWQGGPIPDWALRLTDSDRHGMVNASDMEQVDAFRMMPEGDKWVPDNRKYTYQQSFDSFTGEMNIPDTSIKKPKEAQELPGWEPTATAEALKKAQQEQKENTEKTVMNTPILELLLGGDDDVAVDVEKSVASSVGDVDEYTRTQKYVAPFASSEPDVASVAKANNLLDDVIARIDRGITQVSGVAGQAKTAVSKKAKQAKSKAIQIKKKLKSLYNQMLPFYPDSPAELDSEYFRTGQHLAGPAAPLPPKKMPSKFITAYKRIMGEVDQFAGEVGATAMGAYKSTKDTLSPFKSEEVVDNRNIGDAVREAERLQGIDRGARRKKVEPSGDGRTWEDELGESVMNLFPKGDMIQATKGGVQSERDARADVELAKTGVMEEEDSIRIGMGGPSKFDPEGDGYDVETATELDKLHPLTMPKPIRSGRHDRETVKNEDAFSAWVWHEENGEWVKHGASVDQRTGRLLKGKGYKTFHLEEQASQELGNVISKGEDGYYYSLTPEGNVYGQEPSEKPDVMYKGVNISKILRGTKSSKIPIREDLEKGEDQAFSLAEDLRGGGQAVIRGASKLASKISGKAKTSVNSAMKMFTDKYRSLFPKEGIALVEGSKKEKKLKKDRRLDDKDVVAVGGPETKSTLRQEELEAMVAGLSKEPHSLMYLARVENELLDANAIGHKVRAKLDKDGNKIMKNGRAVMEYVLRDGKKIPLSYGLMQITINTASGSDYGGELFEKEGAVTDEAKIALLNDPIHSISIANEFKNDLKAMLKANKYGSQWSDKDLETAAITAYNWRGANLVKVLDKTRAGTLDEMVREYDRMGKEAKKRGEKVFFVPDETKSHIRRYREMRGW